jgi:hypothetical protein
MDSGKRTTSRDIAEALVRKEHPEATSLVWIPRSDDPGSLEELHYTDGQGDLVPTGVLTVPWSPPNSVRRIVR